MALQLFKVAKLWAYLEPPSHSLIALLTDAVQMLRLTHGPPGEVTGRVTKDAKDLLTQLEEEMKAKEDFQGLSIEERNRIPFSVQS